MKKLSIPFLHWNRVNQETPEVFTIWTGLGFQRRFPPKILTRIIS